MLRRHVNGIRERLHTVGGLCGMLSTKALHLGLLSAVSRNAMYSAVPIPVHILYGDRLHRVCAGLPTGWLCVYLFLLISGVRGQPSHG